VLLLLLLLLGLPLAVLELPELLKGAEGSFLRVLTPNDVTLPEDIAQ
jgi:hypothetical protein